MRYIMVAIWSVLIGAALSYVLSSMGGEAFSLPLTFGFAGVLTVAIIVLGDGVLKGNEESN